MKVSLGFLLALLVAAAPAWAHHSFAAEFDAQKVGKTVLVRGCASRNGEANRYAASFIKLSDGTIQRVGQDVEGIFGTKIWR